MNQKIEEFIHEHSYTHLKIEVQEFLSKIKLEGHQTKEAYILLYNHVEGKRELTEVEKEFIGHQMKDVLKTMGFVTIVALPGGTVFLILLKFFHLNKYILPSVFSEHDSGAETKSLV